MLKLPKFAKLKTKRTRIAGNHVDSLATYVAHHSGKTENAFLGQLEGGAFQALSGVGTAKSDAKLFSGGTIKTTNLSNLSSSQNLTVLSTLLNGAMRNL